MNRWLKLEEAFEKDICPKWLRLSPVIRLKIATVVMVGSVLWPAVAPCLSAYNLIAVHTEINSYWLAGIALLYGTLNFREQSKMHKAIRRTVLLVSVILFFSLVLRSNQTFFFWKIKSVRADRWSEMASYLQDVGTQKEQQAAPTHSIPWIVPAALRPLGSSGDYMGVTGQVLESEGDYTGHTADAEFGNKLRQWGVFEGNKELLDKYLWGCKYTQVGPRLYFYVSTGRGG